MPSALWDRPWRAGCGWRSPVPHASLRRRGRPPSRRRHGSFQFFQRQLEGAVVVPALPPVRRAQELASLPHLDDELVVVEGLVLEGHGPDFGIHGHREDPDVVSVGPLVKGRFELQNRGIVGPAFIADDAGPVRHDQRLRVDPQDLVLGFAEDVLDVVQFEAVGR